MDLIKYEQLNSPDFISTLSTFPYLPKSRSKSDCRASYSKFPQKIGLIFTGTGSDNATIFISKPSET